jgi:hypothetical protein
MNFKLVVFKSCQLVVGVSHSSQPAPHFEYFDDDDSLFAIDILLFVVKNILFHFDCNTTLPIPDIKQRSVSITYLNSKDFAGCLNCMFMD